MKIRFCITLVLFFAFLLSFGSEKSEKPNIILLLADDLTMAVKAWLKGPRLPKPY